MTKRHQPLPRPRTTLRLTGTVCKAQALLDHRSALGLDYANAWLVHHGSLRPPASAVVRRALSLYMNHLTSPSCDPAQEVREVERVCSVLPPDAQAREEAQQRLQRAQESPELPPWPEVLYGPQKVAELASIDARAEALFKQCMAEKVQHMRIARQPTNP